MRAPTFVQFRTAALFLGGMAGAAYVTLADSTDRPTLLVLFGAMMGLPLFLRADEKRQPAPQLPPPPPGPTINASPGGPEAPDD
jgi:hypothetical protein